MPQRPLDHIVIDGMAIDAHRIEADSLFHDLGAGTVTLTLFASTVTTVYADQVEVPVSTEEQPDQSDSLKTSPWCCGAFQPLPDDDPHQPFRCTRKPDHDGDHGYAGIYWPRREAG